MLRRWDLEPIILDQHPSAGQPKTADGAANPKAWGVGATAIEGAAVGTGVGFFTTGVGAPLGAGLGFNLAEMFERASANRRIAQPRCALATLIFERVRQHFPELARTPRGPSDQPASRMAA